MAISSKFGWGLVLTTSLFVACNESNPAVEASAEASLPLGQELYALHCASCHGESGDLGLSGAKNLKTCALTISEIKDIIKSGKNGMPSFRGIIGTESNIDSVSHYVSTLHE
jgi:mono/diheme cytochrome c family protein